jgi:hypothetical protein
MWCGRFTVERVVPLSDMDDMDTEARPHPYIEEFEKMRNCSSTTMPIDFLRAVFEVYLCSVFLI